MFGAKQWVSARAASRRSAIVTARLIPAVGRMGRVVRRAGRGCRVKILGGFATCGANIVTYATTHGAFEQRV
eukprot:3240785-Lingulodinium_polyedra.AAC.1